MEICAISILKLKTLKIFQNKNYLKRGEKIKKCYNRKEELNANWQLAKNSEILYNINPLNQKKEIFL